jgi:hypothetical protein
MARLVAARTPIYEGDLTYARHLLEGMSSDLVTVADSWYLQVHAQCQQWADIAGITLEQSTAITALYSINQMWCGNVTLARNAIVHGKVVGLVIPHRITGDIVLSVPDRVRDILNGRPIDDCLTNGSKVRSFWRALLLDNDACVNDRWMFRIFDKTQGETWYPWVTSAVRVLARLYSIVELWRIQSRLWHAVILDYARQGVRGAISSIGGMALGRLLH